MPEARNQKPRSHTAASSSSIPESCTKFAFQIAKGKVSDDEEEHDEDGDVDDHGNVADDVNCDSYDDDGDNDHDDVDDVHADDVNDDDYDDDADDGDFRSGGCSCSADHESSSSDDRYD